MLFQILLLVPCASAWSGSQQLPSKATVLCPCAWGQAAMAVKPMLLHLNFSSPLSRHNDKSNSLTHRDGGCLPQQSTTWEELCPQKQKECRGDGVHRHNKHCWKNMLNMMRIHRRQKKNPEELCLEGKSTCNEKKQNYGTRGTAYHKRKSVSRADREGIGSLSETEQPQCQEGEESICQSSDLGESCKCLAHLEERADRFSLTHFQVTCCPFN